MANIFEAFQRGQRQAQESELRQQEIQRGNIGLQQQRQDASDIAIAEGRAPTTGQAPAQEEQGFFSRLGEGVKGFFGGGEGLTSSQDEFTAAQVSPTPQLGAAAPSPRLEAAPSITAEQVDTAQSIGQGARSAAALSGDPEAQLANLEGRRTELLAAGIDTGDTDEVISLIKEGKTQQADAELRQAIEQSDQLISQAGEQGVTGERGLEAQEQAETREQAQAASQAQAQQQQLQERQAAEEEGVIPPTEEGAPVVGAPAEGAQPAPAAELVTASNIIDSGVTTARTQDQLDAIDRLAARGNKRGIALKEQIEQEKADNLKKFTNLTIDLDGASPQTQDAIITSEADRIDREGGDGSVVRGLLNKSPAERAEIFSDIQARGLGVDKATDLQFKRDKLNQETATANRSADIRQAELNQRIAEGLEVELSAGAHKTLTESQDEARKQQGLEIKATNLLNRIEAKRDDISSGAIKTVKEAFRSIAGTRKEQSAIQTELRNLINTQVVESLPTGPATDRDIQIFRGGFPPDNDNPEQLMAYLRGAAKVAKAEKSFQQFKSDLISRTGNTRFLLREWKKSPEFKAIEDESKAAFELQKAKEDAQKESAKKTKERTEGRFSVGRFSVEAL